MREWSEKGECDKWKLFVIYVQVNRCNRYLCMHVPIEGLIKANTLRTMCGCKREWNWNWIRNSNRNRLWRNRGRTPRVINVVVVVYGVLAFCLRREKTARAFFPGICFRLRFEAWAYFGASQSASASRPVLPCPRPTNTSHYLLTIVSFFSLKCSNRRKGERQQQ